MFGLQILFISDIFSNKTYNLCWPSREHKEMFVEDGNEKETPKKEKANLGLLKAVALDHN